MFGEGLMKMTTIPASMIISNGIFTNTYLSDSDPLISFLEINTLQVQNISFQNVHTSSSSDDSAHFLGVNVLNAEQLDMVTISQLAFDSSSITAIRVNSIVGEPTAMQTLTIDGFSYTNTTVPTSRSLMTTEGMFTEANIQVEFVDVEFNGVHFATSGKLIEFSHQLISTLMVRNAMFRNISSGSIHSQTFNTNLNNILTRAECVNCTFSDSVMPLGAFISSSNGAYFKMTNSSFTRITSTNDVAGIINSQDGSVIEVENSVFTENSAMTASLIIAESESTTICRSCKMTNNFAVASGVISATASGHFELYDSEINTNYALRNPIGQVFDTGNPSIIDNTQISNNIVVTVNQLNSEMASCSNLCFIGDELKALIMSTDYTDYEISRSAIQIIFGELIIRNGSVIYSQDEFVNSFISSLTLDGSTIENISYDHPLIEVSATTFVINNVTMNNIIDNSVGNTGDFIRATFDSVFNASDVRFSNSESSMFTILSSSANFDILSISEVKDIGSVISVLDCTHASFSRISVTNLSNITDTIVSIKRSLDVHLSDFTWTGFEHSLMKIYRSQCTLIDNLMFTNNTQSLEVVESTVGNLTNSQFNYNGQSSRYSGGAILLQNSEISIHNTTFMNNTANMGGAISFECTSLQQCKLDLSNWSFTGNTAIEKGGAIHYDYLRPTEFEVMFSNNSAKYGNNFGSYAVKIGMVSDPNGNIIIKDAASGQIVSEALEVALIDGDGQITNLQNSGQISIFAADSSTSFVRSTNTETIREGISTFDNIAFESEPGSNGVVYRITSTSIDFAKVNEVWGSSVIQPQVIVDFRYCMPGEQEIGGT